jgi:hypothetical protein
MTIRKKEIINPLSQIQMAQETKYLKSYEFEPIDTKNKK